MQFNFLAQTKKIIESWLLSDNLGAVDNTDGNLKNTEFIKDFGINEMCLLEMYDDKNEVYYTPSIVGKGLVFTKKEVGGEFLEGVRCIFSEHLPQGYGVQLLSQKNEGGECEVVLSLSCSGWVSDEEVVAELVRVFSTIEEKITNISDKVEKLTPSYLLNYLNKIFYPSTFFDQKYCKNYLNNELIREQLLNWLDGSVACEKDRVDYIKDGDVLYSSTLLAVQQYPILKDEKNLKADFYTKLLSDSNAILRDRKKEKVLVGVGIYNPVITQKKEPLIEDIVSSKLCVYSFACLFYDNNTQDNKNIIVQDFKDQMMRIEYQYSTFKNKQLAGLGMFIPLQLDERTIKEVEKMRVAHRIEELKRTDILPLFF